MNNLINIGTGITSDDESSAFAKINEKFNSVPTLVDFSGTLHHDPSANIYDVCSYAGANLNEKWNNALSAMDNQRPKIVIIRRPQINENGARNVSGRGWMWDLNAPLTFDDQLSLAHVYFYGGFTVDPNAVSNILAALHFSPTNKTEDINIYTQISIYGANKMDNGILINGGARIFFNSGSRIVGCSGPAIYMCGVHPEGTNDCYLGSVVSAQNRGPAVKINGTLHQIRATKIKNIQEQGTPTSGTQAEHVLHVSGIVRGFDVEEVKLSAPTTGIGPPTGSVVYIESTTSGIPQFGLHIGTIHQDGNNNIALQTSKGNYTGSTKITGVKLGRSISNSGGVDVDLAWVDEVDISLIRYGDINIDAGTCGVIRVEKSDKATINITWPTDGSERLELWQDGVYTCTKATSSSTLNRARCFTIPVPVKFETSCRLFIDCSGTNGESLYSGSFQVRPTLTGSLAQSTIMTGTNCTAHSARADLTGAPTGTAGNIVWSIEGSSGSMLLHLENNTGNSRTLTATLR